MQPIGGPSRPNRNPQATPAQPPALMVSHPAEAQPPLHTVPPGRPMDPRYRPGSPTHKYLLAQAQLGRTLGEHVGPSEAIGRLEMTPEQASATALFRQNLEAVDPTRSLRNQGEFGQAFHPVEGGMAANTPIHYEAGENGQVTVPPRAHAPGTTLIIHSHPPARPPHPTDADYYSAYVQSEGNRNSVQGEILYDVRNDAFYAFQGRLHPETGGAGYHELVNPFDMGSNRPGAASERALPDPSTWGSHFINWPESRPGTPENPGAPQT